MPGASLLLLSAEKFVQAMFCFAAVKKTYSFSGQLGQFSFILLPAVIELLTKKALVSWGEY